VVGGRRSVLVDGFQAVLGFVVTLCFCRAIFLLGHPHSSNQFECLFSLDLELDEGFLAVVTIQNGDGLVEARYFFHLDFFHFTQVNL